MTIGKLIKSNTHTDYVCQVYGPAEVDDPPAAEEHAFGTFVRVPLAADAGHLVGIIYDTVLLNPEFGALGPRLSPASDLAVFSPDYLAEKVTLVGITAVGSLQPDGSARHGVPALAAGVDALVEAMDDDEVHAFHAAPSGGVRLEYAPLLMALRNPLARYLLLHVMRRLTALFPGHAAQLSVLRGELAWQAQVGPVGGLS